MPNDAKPAERRPESVLVLVYSSDNDVLLLQRSDNPEYWQSVTGALDTDEQPLRAAHRELFEETGLELELIDHQRSRQYPIAKQWRARYPEWATVNTEHLFSACIDAQMPVRLDSAEHLDYRWISASEAIEAVFSATNREAIRDIVLQQHG